MSLHFSACQYDRNFEPKLLQNWEVPDTFRLRPRALHGSTRIISNDSGHLQSGVKRSRASPWGTFIGTWDMPLNIPGNHITNLTARSTDAISRLQRMKTDGDIVLGGKLKKCKIPSPLPIRADDPFIRTVTPDKPFSSGLRSGAKNPEPNGLYKSFTPVKSTSPGVRIRQLTPVNTPKLDWPKPGSRSRSALPNISQNAMSPKPFDEYDCSRHDQGHQAYLQGRSSNSPIVWPAPQTTQLEA